MTSALATVAEAKRTADGKIINAKSAGLFEEFLHAIMVMIWIPRLVSTSTERLQTRSFKNVAEFSRI